MERVTGIGGIFFKAKDPDATAEWYRKNLGIEFEAWGDCRGTAFEWRRKDDPGKGGTTVWSVFKETTGYFDPGSTEFMINYRVDDLDAMLRQLQEAGATLAGGPEDEFNGRFAWVIDPDGRKIELWEPASGN